MSGRRTTAFRSLSVLALTAPMSLALLVTAPAAFAGGTFSSPTPNEGAVLSGSSFTIQVNVTAGTADVKLTVTGKDGQGTTVCTTSKTAKQNLIQDQTLSMSFPSSATCTTTRNARWSALLSGGAAGNPRTFSTNAAPAAPSNFSAQGSGARDVAFSWTKGGEPDLSGYALYDEAGNALDSDIALTHCNGSTCTYALYYPSDNAGTHSYELAAKRASAGCGSCGTEVLSGSRAHASATLVDPPKPTPSPTPSPTSNPTPDPGGSPPPGGTTGGSSGGTPAGGTSGGGTSGSGTTGGGSPAGGTSSGGTAIHPGPQPTLPKLPNAAAAAKRAFSLQFSAFSPSLGIPKLPPLADFPSVVAGEAPLPLGTYQPSLPYAPKTTTEVKTTSVMSQIAAVRNVIDSAQLAKSIAAAFILLLAGAHLRRFLAGHVDQ